MGIKVQAELATDTRGAASYITEHAGVATSHRTLEGQRQRGVGPRYVKIVGRISYRYHDLDEFIESCVVEPSEAQSNG